jgi:tetratricopeptide (TPR) repeat protein
LWTKYSERAHTWKPACSCWANRAGRRLSILPTLAEFIRHTLHRFFPDRFLRSRAADSQRLQAASRACVRLIEVYYHSGDLVRAIFLTFKALNLAEQAEESGVLVEAYAGAGPFYQFAGLKKIADAQFKRANEVHRQVNNLRSYAYLLLVQCGMRIGAGRWDEARMHAQELISAGEQLGSARRINDGLQHRMILEYYRAEFQASSQTAEALLQSSRRIQDARFQGYALFALAYSALHLGKTTEAPAGAGRNGSPVQRPGRSRMNSWRSRCTACAACTKRHGDWAAALDAGGGRSAVGRRLPGELFHPSGYLSTGKPTCGTVKTTRRCGSASAGAGDQPGQFRTRSRSGNRPSDG